MQIFRLLGASSIGMGYALFLLNFGNFSINMLNSDTDVEYNLGIVCCALTTGLTIGAFPLGIKLIKVINPK